MLRWLCLVFLLIGATPAVAAGHAHGDAVAAASAVIVVADLAGADRADAAPVACGPLCPMGSDHHGGAATACDCAAGCVGTCLWLGAGASELVDVRLALAPPPVPAARVVAPPTPPPRR